MEANFFIKELGFDQLQNELPHDIQGKIAGIDKVYYSGDLPAVFFKEVDNFEPKVLKEIAELQKQIWNNSSVVFLYVTSSSEIRIYNCNEKPVYLPENETNKFEQVLEDILIDSCCKTDIQKLEQLKKVFSAIAIDFGSIWTNELNYAKKIKLHTKVDSYLVKSLVSLAKKLNEDIDNEELIHAVLMRSIFIMYLQDRDAIPQKIWDDVGNNDFIKILDDHHKTYKLFTIISKNFNGNAFPVSFGEEKIINANHLKYIKHCLIDGNIDTIQPKLFEWRLFNFKLIRIEMLSEIYESFLSEFNPDQKRITGTYYTPPSLVELVLDNVLPNTETDYNKKILDPACGSGIFLAGAYKRIVKRWINKTKKRPVFEDLSKLLTENIFGVELDKKSIKVTAFSLYLSMLDFLDPKDVWLEEGKLFPNLISDDESTDNNGNNLFRTDTIKPNGSFEKIKYDIILGNPPFGTSGLTKTIKAYCSKHYFDTQYVIPFIHKSAQLAENGKVALLFNTQLLTYPKQQIVNFRNWLFGKNKVEKIYNLSIFRNAPQDFGGRLFSTAKVPVSIAIFYPNRIVTNSDSIEYWAPKTFIKNNVVDGVIIDKTDISYLPYSECIKGESHIWKIAQWGGLADYFLIEKLKNNHKTVKQLEDNNVIAIKAGLHAPEKDKETVIVEGDFLDTRKIQHYYTGQNYIEKIKTEFRKYDLSLFNPPFVGIPQNIMERKICTSFFDKTVFFKSGIFLLKDCEGNKDNRLKNFTILLNSTFSNYYFFLISGSWGIERDQLFLSSEYKTFPVSMNFINRDNELNFSKTSFKENEIDFNIAEQKFDLNFYDNEIYTEYNLEEKEIALIEDFVKYSISLFYDKEKSIALKPISSQKPETVYYAEMICSEINDFFKSGDLKVNAKVYNISSYTPLGLVVIHFVNKNKIEAPILIDANNDFQKNLNVINEYTIAEYSQSIYVRKQVRYYTDDSIYIAKPNQKRFWTRSQAIDDAASIINELMDKATNEDE